MDEAAPRPSILAVDDTVENLRLLTTLLSEHGFEVRPVTSARQALLAVERAPPDLILLDVTMPEMDGYEACRRLREMGHVDVPVIFLTAVSDVADKVRAFEVGGADYVTKPFQLEELLARVRAHLALRRARVDLQRSYARLESLERLRDDLVHMIVHDMRSPLSALINNLDFVAMGAGDTLSAQSREDLGEAVAAAAAINHMANDLLDVSRLERGKLPLDRRATDLGRVAVDVRARLSGLDRDRQIDVDATPVVCVCDGGVIQRVLENLLGNAIQHTPAGGRIRIAVARKGAVVRVAVEDDGPGVPLEAREMIFEKFGTVASRKQETFHSTGLGLAFCKLAVEAHGGRIGVEPGPRSGSIFWFEIPSP